jgi:hypothetical protein
MQSGNPNCQVVDFLNDVEGVASKALNGEATIYTFSYPTQKGASYAFEYAFTSGGTINAKVELEQGNTVPATEGASSANWVVPEDASAFDAAVTDANVHIKAYAPAATAFVRLKITGLTGNAATTVLSRARMTMIL